MSITDSDWIKSYQINPFHLPVECKGGGWGWGWRCMIGRHPISPSLFPEIIRSVTHIVYCSEAKEWVLATVIVTVTVISGHVMSCHAYHSRTNFTSAAYYFLGGGHYTTQYDLTQHIMTALCYRNFAITSSPLLSSPATTFEQKYGDVCPANWQPGDSAVSLDTVKSKEYFRGA